MRIKIIKSHRREVILNESQQYLKECNMDERHIEFQMMKLYIQLIHADADLDFLKKEKSKFERYRGGSYSNDEPNWYRDIKKDLNLNQRIKKNEDSGKGKCAMFIFINQDGEICIIRPSQEENLLSDFFSGYDPLDFFNEDKVYSPEQMLEAATINLLEKMNLPLRKYLVEEHNDKYLSEDAWDIEYDVSILVDGDEYEENRENTDHPAYKMLDYFELSGDWLNAQYTIEGASDGYLINPLDNDNSEKIKKLAENHFNDLIEYDFYNDDDFSSTVIFKEVDIEITKACFDGQDYLLL